MDFITGEKVQMRCEVWLGLEADFAFNPKLQGSPHKRVDLERWNPAEPLPGKRVFVFSHRLRLLLPFRFEKTDVTLFVHNSDENIDAVKANFLRQKVKRVFCQNLLIPTDGFFRVLPIGIANSMWKHGNLELLEQTMRKNREKTVFLCANFSVGTNPTKRQACLIALQQKRIEVRNGLSQEQYLEALASATFSVCPEGNGADSHRIWESLYLRTFPICLQTPFTKNLEECGFPVVLLQSWEELDLSRLKSRARVWPQDLERLLSLKFYFE